MKLILNKFYIYIYISNMNIIKLLLEKFIKEEKNSLFLLIFLSLLNTLIQGTILSFINANIIDSIKIQNYCITEYFFYQFICVSIAFLIFNYNYKILQNKVLTKISQWIKKEILNIILLTSNENMKQINFIEFIIPMTRISGAFHILSSNLINLIIPFFSFLIIIFLYFLYNVPILGCFFIISNVMICLYLYINWKTLLIKKQKNEIEINNYEKYVIDILNNADKVIYRGEISNEIKKINIQSDNVITDSINFLIYANNHIFIIIIIIYIIIIIFMYNLILLYYKDKLKINVLLTLFSILFLYRDKMLGVIQNIPDYLEFIGKIDYIVNDFNNILNDKVYLNSAIYKSYSQNIIKFETIEFQNINFNYDKSEKLILTNLNINTKLTNKIIGVIGLSGKGKSSLVKLLLRLYKPISGNILIDGININLIDPNYIRKNITYVNQNSKLFDRKIIDNIMYGCKDINKCNEKFKEIMKYDKINKLIKHIDYNTKVGSLGDFLSGGQRQIINIINGLVNQSKILILDEPTNALDKDLKNDIILLIKNFLKYKQSIIIITHDKDMNSLFDEIITI